jgi:hypothetical protein
MGMKKNILQVIGEWQLKWYGHIMRMEDCRMELTWEKLARYTSKYV